MVVSGEKKIVKVFIDLSMLEFVDSAALGMILLISDILRERNGHLVLKTDRSSGTYFRNFSIFPNL